MGIEDRRKLQTTLSRGTKPVETERWRWPNGGVPVGSYIIADDVPSKLLELKALKRSKNSSRTTHDHPIRSARSSSSMRNAERACWTGLTRSSFIILPSRNDQNMARWDIDELPCINSGIFTFHSEDSLGRFSLDNLYTRDRQHGHLRHG